MTGVERSLHTTVDTMPWLWGHRAGRGCPPRPWMGTPRTLVTFTECYSGALAWEKGLKIELNEQNLQK